MNLRATPYVICLNSLYGEKTNYSRNELYIYIKKKIHIQHSVNTCPYSSNSRDNRQKTFQHSVPLCMCGEQVYDHHFTCNKHDKTDDYYWEWPPTVLALLPLPPQLCRLRRRTRDDVLFGTYTGADRSEGCGDPTVNENSSYLSVPINAINNNKIFGVGYPVSIGVLFVKFHI